MIFLRVQLKEDNFKLPNKQIEIADNAGFCFGVKRAVDTVKKLKKDNPSKNIYILGELIHNSQVIEELSSCGIKTIEKLPEHGTGICVIRTHGEPPDLFEQVRNAGFELYDLTCPHVKRVQTKAVELVQKGFYLIIIGKEEHPEVAAIKANAEKFGHKIIVADTVDKLREKENELKIHKNIGVVVQTTKTQAVLNEISQYLISIGKEIHISNTICPSTSKRQKEAGMLASNSELMIIVGSKKSANTTNLADISRALTRTIHIETSEELDKYKECISNANKIGVTAGASTPQKIINEVVLKLKSM